MIRHISRSLATLVGICLLAEVLARLITGVGIRGNISHVYSPTSHDPVELRILPLGDSITEGYKSSDENGYRLFLRNLLIDAGYQVDFVGSLRNGHNNEDNQHEGWGGGKIHHALFNSLAHGSFRLHPNIVLLHIGTNDMQDLSPPTEYALETAPDRLSTLIDAILCENPETVLLVAQVIRQIPCQPCVDAYNLAIPEIVAQHAAQGRKVRVVDHSAIGAEDGQLVDGLHPSDYGYERMAEIWFEALEAVPKEWIVAPPLAEGQKCEVGEEGWAERMVKEG